MAEDGALINHQSLERRESINVNIHQVISLDGSGALVISDVQDPFILLLPTPKIKRNMKCLPVRIVWKASSTLDESSADVSRKDKPFFSAKYKCTQSRN